MMKPLNDYLPYLLNRAGARIAASFAEVVRAHGLTLPGWRVLASLNEENGQRMTELARRTSIDASTLSRVIDGLERRGAVRRARSDGDARGVSVCATAEGRALTGKIVPTALRYEELALSGFSARDAAELKRMLTTLYGNMDALDEERTNSAAE